MTVLDQFNIKGRSALVTGAASGLGLAYSETLAEAGAIVTMSDIDAERLAAESQRLRELGGNIRTASLDVTSLEQTRSVVDEHVAECGGLDICFANAGIDPGAGFWNPAGHRNDDGQIDTMDPARWDRAIGINLTGIYYTIREAARVMKPAKRGSIIATSSNASIILEAIVGMPYMPAKAGVTHMCRQVALELAEYGIRVNTIAPGPFVTNIGGGWLHDPEVRKEWDAQVPLGRIANVEQIKALALYLASDASSYVTGSQMLIDGGVALGRYK